MNDGLASFIEERQEVPSIQAEFMANSSGTSEWFGDLSTVSSTTF